MEASHVPLGMVVLVLAQGGVLAERRCGTQVAPAHAPGNTSTDSSIAALAAREQGIVLCLPAGQIVLGMVLKGLKSNGCSW